MTRFNTDSFEKLRPVVRHSLDFYNNVAVSAFYSRPVGTSIADLRSCVYRALDAVIARHGALSALVVGEDTPSPHFVRLPTIDLDKTVEFRASQTIPDPAAGKELDRILEEQHNRNFKPLDGERPMWRLLISHEPDPCARFVASFVYHHAICDGTSGLVFQRSFHSALSKASAAATGTSPPASVIVTTPSDTTLLPSLEELHPLPMSPRYVLKSVWHELVAPRPSTLWTASTITSAESKGRSHFQSLYLTQDTTLRLVKMCRLHRTTITAGVQAMLAAAVLAELPGTGTSPVLLRVDGAVSLRRWLPQAIIGDDSMGDWVSRYLTEHRRAPRGGGAASATELFSWDEARRLKATINAEVCKEGKDSHVALLRFAGDLDAHFRAKVGKPRDESFEFSNIGVFKIDPSLDGGKDGWRVGKMVFSQSADVSGAALEASLVTGADGCLNIGFSWLEGVVEGDWVGRVIQTLKKLVDEQVSKI